MRGDVVINKVILKIRANEQLLKLDILSNPIYVLQAETTNCQSKLKRAEGKISNSRRSVDSVVRSS